MSLTSSSLFAVLRYGFAAAVLSTCLHAQSAPRSESKLGSARQGSPEEVVVLNPFEVRTDSDTGFVATSSLAGGRLAGDLKDTPVAYSVLTRDFIDALQLTDLTSMSQWSTNVTDRHTNGEELATGETVFVSSRGLLNGTPQRNFFPVFYDFDSYNIERLDLARGPNAILFGTSGVQGTTNSVTKRARADRRLGEIKASYGSWDNYRVTLDHNQPLTETLALRLNGLFQDRRGWQEGDSQIRRGLTLGAIWKPFRNTEIRAEGEVGRREQAVITTTFQDNISGWNGTSTFSAPIAATQPANGINRYGRTPVHTPSNGALLVNYQNWATTYGGNAAVGVPAGGAQVLGASPNIVNNSITGQINLPASLYNLAVAGSHFRIPARNMSVFPDGRLLQVGIGDYTLSATQRLGESLFAEVAANYGEEKTETDIGIARSLQRVYIDVNSVLPTGAANPNFLQPYAEGLRYPYEQKRRKLNARGALGYVINNTRYGDFSFNFIAGDTYSKYDRNSFRYAMRTNANPLSWPTDTPIIFRYYLYTDAVRPAPMPSSWTYVNPIAGNTTSVPAGLVRDYTNTAYNQLLTSDFQYAQAAGNAKLLKGRLVLLGAARRDKYKTDQKSIVFQYDNPSNWDGYTRYYKPAAPADWATLAYRTRDTSGNPVGAMLPADTRPRTGGIANPQYASDRFRDDYSPPDTGDSVNTVTYGTVLHLTEHFSVFANYAESFQPPTSVLKLNGQVFQPSISKGKDYGLRMTFLNGSLVANVIRYAGSQDNSAIATANYYNDFTWIITANKLGDLTEGGLNSRGLTPIGVYSDSSVRKTEGWEFELTANFTRNWRLILNAARPISTQTNSFSDTKAYWNKNKETLHQIVIDAGGSFSGEVATFTGTPPSGQSTTEGINAVNGWNDIVSSLASLADGQKTSGLTVKTANIYSDYRFHTGWLNGFRIGAGVNYRGRTIVGNKGSDTVRNPATPTSAIDDPAAGPFDYVYSKAYAVDTLTMNYTRRIRKNYTLSFDLKVDNLLNYDEPIYSTTVLRPVDGDLTNPGRVATPMRLRYITPRSFLFTTTLRY